MIALEDARAAILDAVAPLPPVDVAIARANGLVLAEAVVAREAVPPFANSAMDGYAVRAADTVGATPSSPVRLRVVGELAAGRAPTQAVGDCEAIRIMTGAPVPDGADAIVMVERTERDGDGVNVYEAASTGDHVRAAGGDLQPGQPVFDVGTVLGAAHVGVLASLGYETVRAHPRARVGVLSTGDELVEGEGALEPGQIRDANRPMLLALLDEAGCEPRDLGIARDDEALIVRTLEDAFATCDAVVTSGGVSMGEYDYVKAALDRFGALQWWQVAIKPAKPLAFGVVRDTPVFGLPGNPVSSHVSFELFARPALLRMMGHTALLRPTVRAVAGDAMTRKPDGKLHLDRVRLGRDADGRYVAARTGSQASNALSAMALANGLALLPDGDGVPEGGDVTVMRLDCPPER
ncbi:MAG TPA: gephyrin-like molybdotransferase Glp [Acidimicrobiia bacterium]|nr:gephyrin-like molybdotransferase Glp [Acidimicrobiia bacterium]